jgi:aminocarboxymuconate-semialdehyde decarboxylase
VKRPTRKRRKTSGRTGRRSRAAAGKATKRKTSSRGPAAKPVAIDFHAHIVVPDVLAFSYQKSLFAQAVAGKGQDGHAQALPEAWTRAMTDMPTRLRDMDAMGVDIQVISPSILKQCTYWADPSEALEMERLGNDRIAEAVAQRPDRLVGLGSVPMQDTALACLELERCVNDLNLKGVIISSHVNGIERPSPPTLRTGCY